MKIFFNKAQITKELVNDYLILVDFNSLDINVSNIKWWTHLFETNTYTNAEKYLLAFVRTIK